MAFDHKSQQFLAMAPKTVGIKYSYDIVIRTFGYYSKSRTLYYRLRKDFQLPWLATLGRITSKVSKLNEKSFLLSIFNSSNTSQKGCIVLHHVIYMKKMLLYHGEQLFGKSVDNPSLLAQSSSSSCRAASTDIPDPLSPLLLIFHRLWQVFRATSRILT